MRLIKLRNTSLIAELSAISCLVAVFPAECMAGDVNLFFNDPDDLVAEIEIMIAGMYGVMLVPFPEKKIGKIENGNGLWTTSLNS